MLYERLIQPTPVSQTYCDFWLKLPLICLWLHKANVGLWLAVVIRLTKHFMSSFRSYLPIRCFITFVFSAKPHLAFLCVLCGKKFSLLLLTNIYLLATAFHSQLTARYELLKFTLLTFCPPFPLWFKLFCSYLFLNPLFFVTKHSHFINIKYKYLYYFNALYGT